MKIVKRKITELIAAEYNPRKINKVQEQDLKDSLTRFGLVDPIIININEERKNIVIGGHQRLRVWADLGNTEIDCNQLDLTLDKERELNIRLNKNGGSFDEELVKEYFDYEELTEWGFTPDELFDKEETTADGLIDDDEIPEAKESKVKQGDIWKLGEHRIMCGDSTSSDDVAKLMNGEKVDMVFTDPPYGMNLDADYSKMGSDKIKAGRKHKNIYNDNIEFDPTFIFKNFNYCKDILLFGADYYSDLIPNKINGSWLIWDKRVEARYDKIIGSSFEMIFSKRKIKRELIRYEYVSWANRMKDKVNGIKPHPTMKPVEMLNILLSKFNHHLIADLFLGSGSTLMACEKSNKKCYGMELDQKYCDVIIERWEQFTGLKAEKING